MNYKIVADSSSNLFHLEGAPYACAPLKIISDTEEYADTPELDVYAMLEELKETKAPATTSCPNVHDWLTAFGDADGVFAVTITSGLSGSCAAAKQAAADYDEEHAGARVCVSDSLSVGPEMALIIEKLRDLISEGKSFDEIETGIREYMTRTRLLFFCESLENMARNGRVSYTVAKLVGVLGIRIIGTASSQGTLSPLHKCRGQKKTIATLWEEMQKNGYVGGKVRMDHCLNLRAAVELKELIHKDYPEADVTIGSCTGLCSYYAEQGGMILSYEV